MVKQTWSLKKIKHRKQLGILELYTCTTICMYIKATAIVWIYKVMSRNRNTSVLICTAWKHLICSLKVSTYIQLIICTFNASTLSAPMLMLVMLQVLCIIFGPKFHYIWCKLSLYLVQILHHNFFLKMHMTALYLMFNYHFFGANKVQI